VTRRALVPLALAWLALLAGCGAPKTYVSEPGPYDRVPAEWREPLAAARLALERGDPQRAYRLVTPLVLERPKLIAVRCFRQEIELALLTLEGRLGEDLVASGPEEARRVLARQYEAEAEGRLEPEAYVLAARLAEDAAAALALLDAADTLDPRCVWVHYGRAWWRYRDRRFKEAREALRAAQRLDRGHLPSLRLHATILAGAGDIEPAIGALEVWLERSEGDPLFSGAERADALLDLAALRVLAEEPRAALELLGELDPRAVRDPLRAEAVRAAALQARGDLDGALAAVARALLLRPDALLPLVQRAMLLRAAGDAAGEAAAWRELLARTEGERPGAEIDFEAALFRMQAHARLARLTGGVGPGP
jgi:tetratricopeptide (TPR) repeat protein